MRNFTRHRISIKTCWSIPSIPRCAEHLLE